MRKRILALISASAIVALAFAATPRPVAATVSYDYYISQLGTPDTDRAPEHQNCLAPYSDHIEDAVDDYESGDTIYVCAGTYVLAGYDDWSYFHDGLVVDNGNLTIVGAGASQTFLVGDGDSADTDRGITTDGAADLTIEALTMENFEENDQGGAVYVHTGNFTCTNASFLDNVASDGDGGAVYVNSGNFASTGCTFGSKNRGNYSEYSGGAVYTYGNVTCTNSTFVDNEADDSGGAFDVYNGNVTTTGCTFGSATHGNRAGNWGGAIYVGNGNLTCNSSTFIDNQSYDGGGALYVSYDTTVNKCTFGRASHGNEALAGGGGAIFSDGNFYCANSSFVGNVAHSNGGAVYAREAYTSLNRCTFTDNAAESYDGYVYGGGALVADGDLDCVASTFTHNTATSEGGAVYSTEDVRANKCSFIGNVAESSGGAVFAWGTYNDLLGVYTNNRAGAGNLGGAIYLDSSSSTAGSFARSTFTGNHTCNAAPARWAADIIDAPLEAGCPDDTPYLSGGGAIAAPWGSIRVLNSKFTANGSGQGGAIFVGADDAYIERSTFTGNASSFGGAIKQGAYYDYGGVLEMNRNTFKLNRSYGFIESPFVGAGGAFAGWVVKFTPNGLAASGNLFSANNAEDVDSTAFDGYATDAGVVGYCSDLNDVTGISDGFIHGVLPRSLGYWADGTFWEGTQTINYLYDCDAFIP